MTITESEFCEQLGKECLQVAKDWARARRDGALRARDEAIKSRDKWRKRWQETQNELAVALAGLNKLKTEQKTNTIPAPPPRHVFEWKKTDSVYYDECVVGDYHLSAGKEPFEGKLPIQVRYKYEFIADPEIIPGKSIKESAEQWCIDNVVNKQG